MKIDKLRIDYQAFKLQGTDTQSDGLEDLGDDCNVRMRSRAGSVVPPACDRRQPLAPGAIGKPRDLKGDLASS
jgi:hypothetical protein